MTQFNELGLSEKTLEALSKKGFVTPSPIQAGVIPLLLKGEKNIIGQAETGSGKTAAFGIPLIERLQPTKSIQALILAPTRELAMQIAQEIDSFQPGRKLKILTIYGKQSYTIQIDALKRGVDIVVGTPGRVMDHLERGTLNLKNLKYFILDEADEMLDMGFEEDIQKIFKQTNQEKKVLLFSATMSKNILAIAKKYIGDYDLVSIKKEQATVAQTEQSFLEVQERDKFEALRRIIDMSPDFYGIVFCHTKSDVDELVSKLIHKGYNAEGLHGDLQQRQRERTLKQFKDKKVTILVATDVAARGIDVNDVTHVINYALPQNAERYIHRVGRTGRAGKAGIAITFVTPREYRQLSAIRALTKTDIKKTKVPQVADVIESKKNNLKSDIQGTLGGEKFKDFLDVADFLLSENDAREVVAALLKINYEHDFTQTGYETISEISTNKSSGPARLFIAVGRKEGYSPRSLLELIEKESNVPSSTISDLRIFEEFSFVTTTADNAEKIIDAFVLKTIHGKKAIVSRAKEKDRTTSSFNDRPRRTGYTGRTPYNTDRSRTYNSSRSGSYPARRSSPDATAPKTGSYQKRSNDEKRPNFASRRPRPEW